MNNKQRFEIPELFTKIPTEYRKDVRRLCELHYVQGVEEMKDLIKELLEIPNKGIKYYTVTHEDGLDGG